MCASFTTAPNIKQPPGVAAQGATPPHPSSEGAQSRVCVCHGAGSPSGADNRPPNTAGTGHWIISGPSPSFPVLFSIVFRLSGKHRWRRGAGSAEPPQTRRKRRKDAAAHQRRPLHRHADPRAVKSALTCVGSSVQGRVMTQMEGSPPLSRGHSLTTPS